MAFTLASDSSHSDVREAEGAEHDRCDRRMTAAQGGAREPDAAAARPEVAPPVDYRFTLANERTFLSWIRTALGLLAGGVAVHTLVLEQWKTNFRTALAISCLLLALLVAIGAYLHWRRIRTAMHAGRPLPGTVLVPVLSAGTAFVAILACAAILLH